MEAAIMKEILCLLPEHLKEPGSKLIETSRLLEEERLQSRCHEFGRNRQGTEEKVSVDAKIKDKVEAVTIPIAIARLVMELWSPKMCKHAENLILQKGVEEGYLKEDHLKWVHVLDNQEEDDKAELDKGWLIADQDETIIKLLWNVLDIKTHYNQVCSHRSWVLKSYHRLKEFLPNLEEEIVERHDLSKYAFSQAIGYTLKWVHNTYHVIWKEACDLHLYNEPHHPQTWSKAHTPEEKYNKLHRWLSFGSDSCTSQHYGLNIENIDFSTEDFAEPFLLESYVDMVGVEWERKKGMDENISTRDLAFIHDRYLQRYTKKQHQVISDLIGKIITSDESSKEGTLTGGSLESTVPPQNRK